MKQGIQFLIPPSCVGTHLVLKHENNVTCRRRQLVSQPPQKHGQMVTGPEPCSRLMKTGQSQHCIAMHNSQNMMYAASSTKVVTLGTCFYPSKFPNVVSYLTNKDVTNHHLGSTKNSNKKKLHWEQSTQSITKDMMKYICYIPLLYLHDSLPVTWHKK